jgi:coenzyme F420-reducing hydrogenase alpha subunit
MADEGRLEVQLRTQSGRVADVQVRSTRRTDFSRVLVGLPVDGALRLVPSLFSICAAAQAIAGLEACEAALGVQVDARQQALRRTLAALEALDNHSFQVLVEWPRQVGVPPLVAPFRALRAAIDEVRRAVTAGGSWAVLGGVTGPVATPSLEGLRAAVELLAPAMAMRELDAFEAWARGSTLLEVALEAGARSAGRVKTPLLAPQPPAWFAARLTSEAFSAQPSVDGVPAEAGALGFVTDTALVAQVLAREGRSTWARLVARFADIARLLDVVAAGVVEAQGATPAPPPTLRSGQGAGVADTSRGRLAHAVTLDDGRVSSWRTVAPTEWSFHPAGVLREALLGEEAAGAEARARFLVTALDPCVGCVVTAASS